MVPEIRWEHFWVFPKIVVPQNGWFILENPIKMDDLGGKATIFGNIHLMIHQLQHVLFKRKKLMVLERNAPINLIYKILHKPWDAPKKVLILVENQLFLGHPKRCRIFCFPSTVLSWQKVV